jgi:hypothetical protein
MDHSDYIGVESISEMDLTALVCEDVEETHLALDRDKLFAVVKLWVP